MKGPVKSAPPEFSPVTLTWSHDIAVTVSPALGQLAEQARAGR
jgi:hypothetical protein